MALLAYAVFGGGEWPFKDVVLVALALWFVITAGTGLAATYASAKDDAEIHHEAGVAAQSGTWAEIVRDGLRLGAAPFLWLALAALIAAALGADGLPQPLALAIAAIGAAVLAFVLGLATYAAHVRACERQLRAR